MNHPIRTISLAFATLFFITGCSWSQIFRLSLTLVDKMDGKPITGANVLVDTFSTSEEHKNDPIPSDAVPLLLTDEKGRLDHDISISGYTPTASGGERWYLKVRKKGYEPVVIDIKPKPPPERTPGKPIPLAIKVEMQPVKDSPR